MNSRQNPNMSFQQGHAAGRRKNRPSGSAGASPSLQSSSEVVDCTQKGTADIERDLQQALEHPDLLFRHRLLRHKVGDILQVKITGTQSTVSGMATLSLEKACGGGFAGQVYRCTLEHLELPAGQSIPGLEVGNHYAVKILIPPSRFSTWFRNTIYWLGFQGSFSAQVNAAACRTGLLMQKLIRRGAELRFGRNTAVNDPFASFWDPQLKAYGEITGWVEGRTWRLEADPDLAARRKWKTLDLNSTNSREYIATRRFMAEMVDLLHEMGAHEFARQYEWWTMKSQPNVMLRTDTTETEPEHQLCAIDFRAGLALLPFLPMSPRDLGLIPSGLFRRGALVQFDQHNLQTLDEFVARHGAAFEDLQPVLSELHRADSAYRRSVPNFIRHGWRLPWDKALRKDVMNGLIEGYQAFDLLDSAGAEKLRNGGLRFLLFYCLGVLPFLGTWLRRLLGNPPYRSHVRQSVLSWRYFRLAQKARIAYSVKEWLRRERVGVRHAHILLNHPLLYLIERMTLGFIPLPFLHRWLTEPTYVLARLKQFMNFARDFWLSAQTREEWFLGEIEQGRQEGMLTEAETAAIAVRAKEPFVVKYLKCVAFHFATIPVTQIVSVIIGGVVAGWMLAHGKSGEAAGASFVGILVLFQMIPISPGSICRGGFVLYLMIKERNWRDYLIACPLSFVKYIGYLAFPLQMTTTYPNLARFLAGHRVTKLAHYVPVFGEQGALLEHWLFDLCFNIPQALARWAQPRIGTILALWALVGTATTTFIFDHFQIRPWSGVEINLILGMVCVFFLPRFLFLPLMRRQVKP